MKNFLDIKPLLNRFINENPDIVDKLDLKEIFEAMVEAYYLNKDPDTFNLAYLFFIGLCPEVNLYRTSDFYGPCYGVACSGYRSTIPACDAVGDPVPYWAPEWSLGFIYRFKFPKEITMELIRKIGKAA